MARTIARITMMVSRFRPIVCCGPMGSGWVNDLPLPIILSASETVTGEVADAVAAMPSTRARARAILSIFLFRYYYWFGAIVLGSAYQKPLPVWSRMLSESGACCE